LNYTQEQYLDSSGNITALTKTKSTTRIQTVVPNEIYAKLLEIAASEEVQLSDLVRKAIEKHCKDLGYDIKISSPSWGGSREGSGRK